MAHAPAAPTAATTAGLAPTGGYPAGAPAHATPVKVTPGKFATWLFLATEVMFFTGLIGSYIVLRVGSPPRAYSNQFAPATELTRMMDAKGVSLVSAGSNPDAVAEVVHKVSNLSEKKADHLTETQSHHLLESLPAGVVHGLTAEKAAEARDALTAAGATAKVEDVVAYNWPKPYDHETNPLSIDLTAANTFILICSSVTMVLALGAVQRGERTKFLVFLGATVAIGSLFLSIQVYEYYSLMVGHHYPVGISQTGHFRPSSSLFASCFFTMTGFHGAHVAGGVVMLTCLFIGALQGRFSAERHSPVELIGLYWHFVDLVWIILFTVVYLV